MSDPLRTLGLDDGATVDDVRAARRELAKRHHPDRGGDPAEMQAVNEAADAALRNLSAPTDVGVAEAGEPSHQGQSEGQSGGQSGGREPWSGLTSDVPSFTVEALPVETFEGLLIVASWLGEVLDDDPPYRLDVHLDEPFDCWCRLDVVPDAGASTVSLMVAGIDGARAPDIELVRDAWVANLNTVDWA